MILMYPIKLLNYVGLPNKHNITIKNMYQNIILKCNKISTQKYNVPKELYIILANNNTSLLNNINDNKSYYMMWSYEIKRRLYELSNDEINNDDYITTTSIYSDIPIQQLEVFV